MIIKKNARQRYENIEILSAVILRKADNYFPNRWSYPCFEFY